LRSFILQFNYEGNLYQSDFEKANLYFPCHKYEQISDYKIPPRSISMTFSLILFVYIALWKVCEKPCHVVETFYDYFCWPRQKIEILCMELWAEKAVTKGISHAQLVRKETLTLNSKNVAKNLHQTKITIKNRNTSFFRISFENVFLTW